ncbi:MAG: signal peptidase II [Bacillota bacterium]
MCMFIFIGTILVIIDQLIKYNVNNKMVIGQTYPIIENFLHITYVKNTGIAFGLFKNNNLFMISIIIIIIVIVIYFYKREKNKDFLLSIATTVMLSGAIGNLIDRIFYGYIIDYIDFQFWPAFNLADSLIVIGSILLGIYLIFNLEKA